MDGFESEMMFMGMFTLFFVVFFGYVLPGFWRIYIKSIKLALTANVVKTVLRDDEDSQNNRRRR
jgi:hypothetical protein|tara:strand:+ start:2220 stop:2411 length:192 start_codon:yes stop_codon:yes gene_type:complete